MCIYWPASHNIAQLFLLIMHAVLMLVSFFFFLMDSNGLKARLNLKNNLIFTRLDQLSGRNNRYDDIRLVPIVLKFTSTYNTIAFDVCN